VVLKKKSVQAEGAYSPDVSPPCWSYSEDFSASHPNCNVKYRHFSSPAGGYMFTIFCICLPQLVGVSSQSEDMKCCDNKEPRPV